MLRRLATTAATLLLLAAAAGSPATAAPATDPSSPVTTAAGGYVRGGDPFRTATGSARCVVGFTVTKTNFKGFLTAGGCGTPGQAVYGPGGDVMGYFTATSFPGNSFGLVQLNPEWIPLGVIRTGPASTAAIRGSTEAAIGAQVCRYGSTTGYRCGTVQAKNQTVNYAEGAVHGLTRTSICAEAGDTGGPVVAGSQAQGLHLGGSGNCTTGGTSYFQPVNEALAAYGLRLVLG